MEGGRREGGGMEAAALQVDGSHVVQALLQSFLP